VPALETERLTKFYGADRGIEDVTMRVEEGEVFGFLGPNGAGKTTTIRTVLDFLHPSGGSARIFGLDSHRERVQAHARLGNLPGDFGYGKHSTGREAIQLVARLRGVGELDHAEQLADRFRATLDRPLGELSRGNRQKVGLILALFHRPDLLILDEPTSGLDPLIQEEFLSLMREERDRGRSIFISSHELDEIERMCDRVAIIREGRLAAIEKVSQLFAKTARRGTAEFGERVPTEELRRCPGVTDLQIDGRRATFRVAGPPGPLLELLAQYQVSDLELTHPTLEEVFLGYYRDQAA
jgi:ABC-2 type transport system ATP-binding protein